MLDKTYIKKPSTISIESIKVSGCLGIHVSKCIHSAIYLARSLDTTVHFSFNCFDVGLNGKDVTSEVLEKYYQYCNMKGKQ